MRKGPGSNQERAVPTPLSMRPSEARKWKVKAHQLNKTFSELVRLSLETLLSERRSDTQSGKTQILTMWFTEHCRLDDSWPETSLHENNEDSSI